MTNNMKQVPVALEIFDHIREIKAFFQKLAKETRPDPCQLPDGFSNSHAFVQISQPMSNFYPIIELDHEVWVRVHRCPGTVSFTVGYRSSCGD